MLIFALKISINTDALQAYFSSDKFKMLSFVYEAKIRQSDLKEKLLSRFYMTL